MRTPRVDASIPRRMVPARGRHLAGAALVLASLLAACGSDDAAPADTLTIDTPASVADTATATDATTVDATTAAATTVVAPTSMVVDDTVDIPAPSFVDGTADIPLPVTPDTGNSPDAPIVIEVTVGVDSSPDRVENVPLGAIVSLVVTNPDSDDEFHLHGYDLGDGEEILMGQPSTMVFTADEAGQFELESHETGDVLLLLNVA